MGKNKVVFGNTTIMDITDTTAEAADVASGKVFYDKGGNRQTGSGNYMDKVTNPTADDILVTDANGQAVDSGVKLSEKQDTLVSGTNIKTVGGQNVLGSGDVDTTPPEATETVSGTVKLNPSEFVTLNDNGQLDVGGRLGQMANTTGIFAPKSIRPAAVGDGSLLLTEGSGTSLGPKSLAVSTGRGQTVRSAAAGSTVYRVENTYINRIACSIAAISGAVVALDENSAKQGKFANVLSVQINGASYTPDSSANQTATANDIVITLDKTVNPDAATTNIRFYPAELGFSTVHCGMGIGSKSGNGASVIVGQGVVSNGGNACALVGADIYNTGNGNAVFGRQHISRKNRWFMSGTGHDNTGGKSESGAVFGEWALISSDTAFAIGNGTSQTNRSNLFEIKTNGDVYLKGVKVLP